MKKYIKEILIIISLIILIIAGSYGWFYFRYIKPNLYTVAFYDVDGVIVGSPVHFVGVTIGHVRKLKIKDNMVIVEIIVTHPNVKIPKGATIKVEFSGMGGSKSMEVQYNPEEERQDALTSEKPIRIADIFRFNKMYAASMLTFEKKLRKVNNEEVQEAIRNIPNGTGKEIRIVTPEQTNEFFEDKILFTDKINSFVDNITDKFGSLFPKKIPEENGDKSN